MDLSKKVKSIFNNNVEYVTGHCTIFEKDDQGLCECKISCDEGVLFKSIDDNKCNYFKIQNNSDYFIFVKSNDEWVLNIIELKRTIKTKSWDTIQKQFIGSYLHGLAMSKVLDIDICDYKFHTIYTNEKIKRTSANDIEYDMNELRADMYNVSKDNDWFSDKYTLEIGDNKQTFEHCKHQLPSYIIDGKSIFKGEFQL